MRRRWWTWVVCLAVVAAVPRSGGAGQADPLLARIKAVGKEGAGNRDAGRAWKELVALGPSALPEILAALDDADPVAANWLRTAVEAIAEHELTTGRPPPADKLEAFIREKHHAGPARRLAYEWLVRVDPTTPARLLPGMLHDPGAELRRDAVDVVLREARALLDKGDRPAATAAYRKAFDAALDPDQVDQIAGQLKTLGVTVDLAAHFGFIRDWGLQGPFENKDGKGFAEVFPEEKWGRFRPGLVFDRDLSPRKTIRHRTTDPHGIVDLNKAIGKHMGAVALAEAIVESPRGQAVEIRAGSNNAIKIFLNGQLLFAREEYHHGMRMDQHVGRGRLRAGQNAILIKVCQNEQKEDWAQNWSFQARLCNAIGEAVPWKEYSGGFPGGIGTLRGGPSKK